MSQLFEGFSRARIRQSQPGTVPLAESSEAAEARNSAMPEAIALKGMAEPKKLSESEKARSVMVQPPPTSRLVAWTEPNSLGAEKFRALAVRLDDMRRQHELKSLQVTSSVINEGK